MKTAKVAHNHERRPTQGYQPEDDVLTVASSVFQLILTSGGIKLRKEAI
ncbi:MAG: hypothetical protein QNJ54_36315 [Prochloraceae cyanobacterium]|nr:hypothetical protein [Prochloraceae cyanobacterium]